MTSRSTAAAAAIDRSTVAAKISHITAMIDRSLNCTDRIADTVAGCTPGCSAIAAAAVGSGCWLCGSLRPSCSQPY